MAKERPQCRGCGDTAGSEKQVWGGGVQVVSLIDMGDLTFLCHPCACKAVIEQGERIADLTKMMTRASDVGGEA